jgi:hypothetical protein
MNFVASATRRLDSLLRNLQMAAYLTIFFALLISSVSGLSAQEQRVGKKNEQEQMARLVTPILDPLAKAYVRCGPQPAQGDKCGLNQAYENAVYAVNRLFGNKSRASTHALVVLMSFYLGEATGEDMLHNVTKRGKAAVPYLLKYQDHPPVVPNRRYPDSIRLPEEVRKEDVNTRLWRSSTIT